LTFDILTNALTLLQGLPKLLIPILVTVAVLIQYEIAKTTKELSLKGPQLTGIN
ncbi:hypothetical protein L9F63_003283, partial [Diploptera punctata]